jgi:nicotinamide-nucleotide amidase
VRAAVLLVGDELLAGIVSDLNLAAVARVLARHGVPITEVATTGDDRKAIADAARRLAARSDLLVVTGGLGPTADDVTREALADAAGVSLGIDDAIRTSLEERLRRYRLDSPVAAVRQAGVPTGWDPVENREGSAPGLKGRLGSAEVWVLPGVPREARAMVDSLAAGLPGFGPGRSGERLVATAGLSEVRVATLLDDAGFRPPAGIRLGYLPAPGGVRLRLAAPTGAPDAELDRAAAEVRALLGVSALPGTSLPEGVVEVFRESGRTLATAESCTGGAIGKRITDVPGSSSVYLGGIIAYSNRAKVERLGIASGLLEERGAVSEEVALAMADGARARFGASVAVSVTGIAGPGGGSPDKPVGTIWIGIADERGTSARRSVMPGDRPLVRERTINKALEMAYRRVRELG